MDRGARETGNTEWQLPVAANDEMPLIGMPNSEELIITTLLSPSSMSHAHDPSADGWAEPSDGLQGTAVFDATGDKTAMPSWDELVRQHADRVYRLAYRLSGNQHDAEDLTQETFIRVFRSVQNYQPGTFEGWLHRITTNLFLDMVRRRSRIRMEALPEDYERVPADEPNPEEIYHDSRLGPDLQAALDSLPPEFRAAVVLCDIEGLSYEEIGATLGVKLGTVRSRIHRGRQALRDYLAAHPDHDALRASLGVVSARPANVRAAIQRLCGLGLGIGRPVALHSKKANKAAIRMNGKELAMPDRGHVFRRAFSWLPAQFASQSDAPVGAPRQFGSTEHLSVEAIAAFVDGELRMNAHLRAAHHLSQCAQCAAEVDDQSRARAALRDSRPIRIPANLLGMLAEIPYESPDAPDRLADRDARDRRRRP
ncbi:RNA polymerase sigma-70 factor [Mycobacterium avium 104]|uniref:ECF RNA polymerase sigma factor SigE n=4 Tax=Mycobacterium TaxID=1763 RepID=A0A0H2ZWH1_MYCA1|nr:RNA polymerase sigma-70 factor [Mycobacterium avium 104]